MVRFLAASALLGLALADVIDLTNDNFKSLTAEKEFSVVKFFAPWCGHCKAMAQDWIEAGKSVDDDSDVLVGNVDCTVEKALCSEMGVRGYPTIKSFRKGTFFDDKVPRQKAQIVSYINKNKNAAAPAKEEPKKAKSENPFPETYVAGAVHKVVTSNFDEIVMNSDKHVFLKVYAPWCGHCKSMAPNWVTFAKEMESRFDDVIIAEFDATANDLPAAYSIRGYPTVYWAEKGNKGKPEKYTGARSIAEWSAFVAKKAPEEDDSEEDIPEPEEAGNDSKDEL